MREDFEPQRGDIFCVELLGLKGEIPSLLLVLQVREGSINNIDMKIYSFNDNTISVGCWDWKKYPDKRRITLVARLTED